MTKLLDDLSAESPNVTEVLSALTGDNGTLYMFRVEGYKDVVYELMEGGKDDIVKSLLEATNITLDSRWIRR